MSDIKLSHAVLHEPNFMPGKDGKAVNLKPLLDPEGVEGKQLDMKLTLKGEVVEVATKRGTGLIPVSAFKMLVPFGK